MKRLLALTAAALVALGSTSLTAEIAVPTASDIADFITELDVTRARELLSKLSGDSPAVALERARLSLYVGDCDTAGATLAAVHGRKEAAPLAELARTCSRATAGSVIVEDAGAGLWLRLQDGEDRALVPVLTEIAVRARAAVERDLGVALPRPLRIDLVRDLFSLSAISGLPLEAAETTGTVAVARWGRVTMISPRAAPNGFPWEDTLAHEITHLVLSRATRDEAPLWLQEGLAKRQETRWRPPRPFDGEPNPDTVARDALFSGESVGVDRLGPSIAMLPSADAATIAFAEVASFMGFFVQEMGAPALRMLFLDLKELGSERASDALRSASGYDLPSWIVRWRAHLVALPVERPGDVPAPGLVTSQRRSARELARGARAAELLFQRGAPGASAVRLERALEADSGDPRLRWRLGRSLIADGRSGDAKPLFDDIQAVDAPHAGWFALSGRFRRESGAAGAAKESFESALALDPYLEDAACLGSFEAPKSGDNGRASGAPAVLGSKEQPLCEAAKKIPRD